VRFLPCAFCGIINPLEDAHIKDEQILLKEGLSKTAARQGNIIPLCRVHHREYFDYPRDGGRGENKEFQFEPRLIIDFINKNLILYDNRYDRNDNDSLFNSIQIVPIYKYTVFSFKKDYAIWKNKKMNSRLNFYLMKKGLLRQLTHED
jgi:hypothetical protein